MQVTRVTDKRTDRHRTMASTALCICIVSNGKNELESRRMYWRRTSIQDGQAFTRVIGDILAPQAPGDATVLKRFFRDYFVIFRHRSQRIAFLESVNFSTSFQFSWWSRDHFLAPFRGLYLPNAWSQTLLTSKMHTFRVSAFHRYHRFGVKLFPVGCALDSRRVP